MDPEFVVTGHFYTASGYKLRTYLDIKRVGAERDIPDLMVVMMNPGSSFPLDNNDNNSVPSKAEPDTTQRQIMKLMNGASFDYSRILNLSDLRTPKSNDLYHFLKSEASRAVDHSIFSANRKAELDKRFIRNVPAVFGWGVHPALVPLAKLAVASLEIKNPLGMLKPNSKYSYYHPLPRSYIRQLEWVQHVTGQIFLSR